MSKCHYQRTMFAEYNLKFLCQGNLFSCIIWSELIESNSPFTQAEDVGLLYDPMIVEGQLYDIMILTTDNFNFADMLCITSPWLGEEIWMEETTLSYLWWVQSQPRDGNEGWIGWVEALPKSGRATGRQFRKRPVDYILIKESLGLEKWYEHISVQEFSSLPLKFKEVLRGDVHYHLSNRVGLLVDEVAPFTAANDLQISPSKSIGRALGRIPLFSNLTNLCRGIWKYEEMFDWSQVQIIFWSPFSFIVHSYLTIGKAPFIFPNKLTLKQGMNVDNYPHLNARLAPMMGMQVHRLELSREGAEILSR